MSSRSGSRSSATRPRSPDAERATRVFKERRRPEARSRSTASAAPPQSSLRSVLTQSVPLSAGWPPPERSRTASIAAAATRVSVPLDRKLRREKAVPPERRRPGQAAAAARAGAGGASRSSRVLVLVVLLVLWSLAGYLSVRSGVSDANKRLPAGTTSVLAKKNGLILSSPTNILLLGTDHATNGQVGRSTDEHSDSMMLLRTDPSRHRLIYLSIPRDLGVTIPGSATRRSTRRCRRAGRSSRSRR